MTKKKYKTVQERFDLLKAQIDEGKSNIENVLAKALLNRSPRIRWLAAESIGKNRIIKLLPNLLSILHDTDSLTRRLAIESIGKLTTKKQIALEIVNFLHDPDELVRVATAETLAIIGNKQTLPNLESSLSDSSSLVRAYVAFAVGSIGSTKHILMLEARLAKEEDEIAKVDLYGSLYFLGAKSYLQKLLNQIISEDEMVRSSSINTLQLINLAEKDKTKVVSRLTERLKFETSNIVKGYINKTLQYFLDSRNC